MEFNTFLSALKASLIRRGIDDATATRCVASMAKKFSEQDRREIAKYQSPDEFRQLSDGVAAAIKRRAAQGGSSAPAVSSAPNPAAKAPVPPTSRPSGSPAASRPSQAPVSSAPVSSAPVSPAPVREASPRPAEQPRPDMMRTSTVPVQHREGARPASPVRTEDDTDIMEIGENGKKIFVGVLIVGSPLWLFLALLFGAAFAAMYLGVSLFIACTVVLLIGVVAGGGAVALAGLIYGVIRLFSVVPEGLYEIGLGVIIIGLVTIFGILLYNTAIRWLPLLYGYITRFLYWSVGKLKELFLLARKECYKL